MEKKRERIILLNRFFDRNRRLYYLGRAAGIQWFDNYETKFKKDKYAYFSDKERAQAKEEITKLGDKKFTASLNKIDMPQQMQIDRFVGHHYHYDARKGAQFTDEDHRDEVRKDVQGALKETSERAYHFLKSIILLKEEEEWDNAYGGAVWSDILAKMRELGGGYPSPRDVAIVKSYRIYYKTGSRRYPTHTVPEEMIPTIDKELEQRETKADHADAEASEEEKQV